MTEQILPGKKFGRKNDLLSEHNGVTNFFRALMLLTLFMPGACASGTSIEDSAPVAAVSEPAITENTSEAQVSETDVQVASEEEVSPPVAGTAQNGNDGYPNLNVRPDPAEQQLTESEKDAKLAELKAAKAKQSAQGQGAGKGASEVQRLKRLARTHANDALKEIENE